MASAGRFFVVMTGAERPVMRAGVMTTIALVGVLIGRPRATSSILAVAVLVLAGAYVPGPRVVIELSFADGSPVHALQAVKEEP